MRFRKVVTTCEVGGGVAVEEHLMELCSEMAKSVLAVFSATFEGFESVAIAEIPVCRLTRLGFEIVGMCLTILIVRVEGFIKRRVAVADVVIGSFTHFVLDAPCSVRDKTIAKGGIELIDRSDQPFATSLDKVLEGGFRGKVLFGYTDNVAKIGKDELLTSTLAAILHAIPEIILCFGGKGLRLTGAAEKEVDTVDTAVGEAEVFTVSVHGTYI